MAGSAGGQNQNHPPGGNPTGDALAFPYTPVDRGQAGPQRKGHSLICTSLFVLLPTDGTGSRRHTGAGTAGLAVQ